MNELTAALNAMCDEVPYDVRWHVRDVRSGDWDHRNGDDVVPSASTRKIAIMMTIFRRVSEGTWDLSEELPVTEEYQRGNFIGAVLDLFDPGLNTTLRDHVIMMITLSDNVSTKMLVEKIGLDAVNELCADLGMDGTRHRDAIPSNESGSTRSPEDGNTTTANDQGVLLERILEGSRDRDVARALGCDEDLCGLALDILARQKYRDRIPALLPQHARVAHKTGTVVRGWTESGVPLCEGFHDVGIVFDGDDPRYVLSVFTNDVPEELERGWPGRAHTAYTTGVLSRMCWEYFTDGDLSSFRAANASFP